MPMGRRGHGVPAGMLNRGTLWAVADDDFDGRRMYAQLAYATPFRGHTAKFAAEQLLTATWRAERLEMCDEDLRGACVD